MGGKRSNWVEPGAVLFNALVANGPIRIEMNVPPDFPSLREHRIYEPKVDASVAKRHSMLLVGHDSTERIGTLRNSMGPSWGNAGFVTLRIGTGGALDYFYGMAIGVA